MAARDLWVFAYGSLIWRPDFAYAERLRARLPGYRRRFCMASIRYRGTPEAPGLVLALAPDADGACAGLAYRVPGEAAAEVRAYLQARELVSYAYLERHLPVELETGATVEALAYVTDPDHPQYRGGLSLDEQAAVIARARGPMGPNVDYLMQTEASLAAHGLPDPEISALATLVRQALAGAEGAADRA